MPPVERSVIDEIEETAPKDATTATSATTTTTTITTNTTDTRYDDERHHGDKREQGFYQ